LNGLPEYGGFSGEISTRPLWSVFQKKLCQAVTQDDELCNPRLFSFFRYRSDLVDANYFWIIQANKMTGVINNVQLQM